MKPMRWLKAQRAMAGVQKGEALEMLNAAHRRRHELLGASEILLADIRGRDVHLGDDFGKTWHPSSSCQVSATRGSSRISLSVLGCAMVRSF
jgi:hypothetical protein